MGLFSKINDWLVKFSGDDSKLTEVPNYEKLTPEIIDATDDTDLDTLLFNQVMLLSNKNDCTYNEQVIRLGEAYINCTLLSQAFMMANIHFEMDLAENIELLPYFPRTFEAVNCPDLKRLFEELIQFIEREYQNKLPFNFDDEDCLESQSYLEFENKMKPFAEAFRQLIKTERIDLLSLEVEYIKANKHKFIG